MTELDRYLQAATRDNTRRSYRAAIEHFEVSWGGFLPATSDSVARYLVAHAGVLSINTLKLRRDAKCPMCGDNPTIKELIDYEEFCSLRH